MPPKKDKPAAKKPVSLSRALSLARMKPEEIEPYKFPVQPPALPRGVVPEDKTAMVMDSSAYQYAQENYMGQGFPGYARVPARGPGRAVDG